MSEAEIDALRGDIAARDYLIKQLTNDRDGLEEQRKRLREALEEIADFYGENTFAHNVARHALNK